MNGQTRLLLLRKQPAGQTGIIFILRTTECRSILYLKQKNNSVDAKEQMTKVTSAKFQKKSFSSKLCRFETSKTSMHANCLDVDEVAHYEPPHQDLRCLQIQLFPSLALSNDFTLLKK